VNATAARPAFGRDPAVTAAVIVLWLLLALFVVYPLAMLFVRIVVDKGALDLSGIVKILTDRHQVRAFWNSLLLAFLVGIAGTLIGFLFAFTAARTRLPRAALTLLDASVLLPLVSPPFTTAIAMIFSFGPRGLITYDLLGIKGVTVYGLTSTLCSEVLTYFPIAYLTLRPILAAIDSNVEGIGQTRVTKNLENIKVDQAYRIPDQLAVSIIYQALREEGMFLGFSAGINLGGALSLARERGPGQTIVTILCDSGHKYQSRLFNPEWLATHNLDPNRSVESCLERSAEFHSA